MTVTKPQADMLAALAVAARPHGAPRWDAPGVVTAIGKVKHLSLAEVMRAVANAAADRDLNTPGAIANTTAPCWRTPTGEPPPHVPAAIPRHERCSTCSKIRGRCETERLAGDDHTFTPDIRQTTDTDTRRTVDELKTYVQPMRDPADRTKTTEETP